MKKIKIVTMLIVLGNLIGCVSTKPKITKVVPKIEKRIKKTPIPKLSDADKQRILALKLKSILKTKRPPS